MGRRKTGVLLPIEDAILDAGIAFQRDGQPDFHGFALAEALGDGGLGGKLLGHGTLYKALSRLEREALLESRWEEVDESEAGRPRRRLYRVTGSAAAALATSRAATGVPGLADPGIATT